MNVSSVSDVSCARCPREVLCCLGSCLKGLKGYLNSEINFSREKKKSRGIISWVEMKEGNITDQAGRVHDTQQETTE